MAKGPGRGRGPKLGDTVSNSWRVADAQERFYELLDAAANHGPQTIVDNDRRFQLTLTRSRYSPDGKELLLSGGRVAAGKPDELKP